MAYYSSLLLTHRKIASKVASIALVTAAFALSSTAYAQIGEATGSADPGRIGQQFEARPSLPDVSPRISIKGATPQEAPEGAENIKFVLNSIEFQGGGTYTAADLESEYQDSLGQEVSLADVYAIAQKLTNKYRNDGYILTQVDVPPQTIDGGVVKLRVIEGFLNNVIIEGEDDENAIALIRRYASKLQSGGPLNVRNLERYLFLINDLPGMDSRVIIEKSATQVGAADLRILVERDPYDALIALDNFGSRYLGPIQTSVFGAANSFFGNNERITAQFVAAPDEDLELAYGSVSYTQPIFDDGTKIKLRATATATQPGFDLTQFNVNGHSRFYSAKVSHPFVRSRAFNVYGDLGFDWRDVKSTNDLEPKRTDRIRSLRVGGKVEFLDTLLGFGINSINFQLSQGLSFPGASETSDANLSRPAGDPQYTKLNAEVQRLQRIVSGVNLLLAGSGQLASNALLSSEEFGVGGQGYGRGYDPSEIVGDEGFAAKAEIQWDAPYKVPMVQDYQLYGFFDAGRVYNLDSTTQDLVRESISSTGLGVRADFTEGTSGGLSMAIPLTRNVDTSGDKGMSVYFNLQHQF
jgi:hemolysin activation/secretion protein